MKNSIYFKKIIINCVISILIIAGAVFIFLVPTANKLKTARNDIEEQKEALEKIYIRGQSLRKISENIKAVEPDLESLEKIFIRKKNELDFITSLEKAAEQSGIKQRIGNFNYPSENGDDKKTFLKIVPIQLTSSGSFSEQIKYLTALEKLNYYISVKNLEISGSGGRNPNSASEEVRIDMQLIANTYWLKPIENL